jgi:hypothetical protein
MLAAALDRPAAMPRTPDAADAGVLTIEFKIQPAGAGARAAAALRGRGDEGRGDTISVVDGRAFQHESGRDERKLVATMTATIMTVTGRDDVRH